MSQKADTSQRSGLSLLKGHIDSVLCLAANDSHLLSGSEDCTARLWDLQTSKTTRCFRAFAEDAVTSVTFSPTNKDFVYASAGSAIYGFDLRSPSVVMKEASSSFKFNADEINQIFFHPKGAYLGAADDSGEIKVIDVSQNRVYKTLRNAHQNICSSVLFRPQTTWQVVSGGMDCRVVSWDFSTGKPKRTFDTNPADGAGRMMNPPFVHSLAASHDGQHLAAGLGNAQIAMYDLKANRELFRLEGHHAAVSQVEFAKWDPSILLSAGNDRCIVMWDFSEKGSEAKAPATKSKKSKSKAKKAEAATDSSSSGDASAKPTASESKAEQELGESQAQTQAQSKSSIQSMHIGFEAQELEMFHTEHVRLRLLHAQKPNWITSTTQGHQGSIDVVTSCDF